MPVEAYCPRSESTADLPHEFDEPLEQCPMCGSSAIKNYDMFHHLFFYDPRTLTKIMRTHYGYEIVVTEGDPVIGLKSMTLEENWRTRLSSWVRRKYPFFESSFRLVARKPAAASRDRRIAA